MNYIPWIEHYIPHILWYCLCDILQTSECACEAQREREEMPTPYRTFLAIGTALYPDFSGEARSMHLSKLRTVHFNYVSLKWIHHRNEIRINLNDNEFQKKVACFDFLKQINRC